MNPHKRVVSPRGNVLAVLRLVVSTASRADSPNQATDSLRERRRTDDGADRPPCRFGDDEDGDQRRAGRPCLNDGHHRHGDLLWKARSRCYAVIERGYRPLHCGPYGSACGLGSCFKCFGAEGRPSPRCLTRARHGGPWWRKQR